jgi:acyl carrier protein
MPRSRTEGLEVDRAVVVSLICQTAREIASQAPDVIGEETYLFGSKGFLDSLGLVSVVLDVEQKVNDLYGLSISLADDRSVSQQRSPFRSVASFADYILMLSAEWQRG